jgi:hypothetical protein
MSARLHVGLIGFTAVPLSEFDVDYQPKLESLDRRKPWENKVGLIFFPTHSGYARLAADMCRPLAARLVSAGRVTNGVKVLVVCIL